MPYAGQRGATSRALERSGDSWEWPPVRPSSTHLSSLRLDMQVQLSRGRPAANCASQTPALSKYRCPGGSSHSSNKTLHSSVEAASLAADCTASSFQTDAVHLSGTGWGGATVHHGSEFSFMSQHEPSGLADDHLLYVPRTSTS